MEDEFPIEIRNLYHEMVSQLEKLNADHLADNFLTRAKKSIEMCRGYLSDLKEKFGDQQNESIDKQIFFTKKIKPVFFQWLIYYQALFDIELRLPAGSRKIRDKYYSMHLQELDLFFTMHADLYKYFRSESTELDHLYFTSKTGISETDPLNHIGKDYLLGQIRANDRIVKYLEKARKALKGKAEEKENVIPSNLYWTASKSSLVELIYALQSNGVYNKGKIEVKQIASQFEQFFHVDLGNYYGIFNEIRLRKKNRTPLLDEMKEKVIKRMDDLDAK